MGKFFKTALVKKPYYIYKFGGRTPEQIKVVTETLQNYYGKGFVFDDLYVADLPREKVTELVQQHLTPEEISEVIVDTAYGIGRHMHDEINLAKSRGIPIRYVKSTDLHGLYLYQDQGKYIYENDMPYMAKGRAFVNKVHVPHFLVSDHKAYGIVAMEDNKPMKQPEIFDNARFHPHQTAEWGWMCPEYQMYQIPYTFVPFPKPLLYKTRPGVRGFDNNPQIEWDTKTRRALPKLLDEFAKKQKENPISYALRRKN